MPVSALLEPVQVYIRREQVLQLAKQLPVNLIANLCVVNAFVFVYYNKSQINTLIIWVIYSQLVNLYGLYLTRRYRDTIPDVKLDSCLRYFSYYAIADGLTFAAAIWLFFVPGAGFYNIFLFIVLLGISAGGQTTLFSHLYSAIPFSFIIVAAVIIRLLSTGQAEHLVLAGMALVFSAVLMRIAFSFNRNLLDTWRLRYELEAELQGRKEMEKNLRDSEQRYRDIVELSPDAIIIQQDGYVVYANDSALRMLGEDSMNAVKKYSVESFLEPALKKDDQKATDATQLQQITQAYMEAKLRLDKEIFIDVELRSKAINYNGMPALQIIIQDITERKQMDKMKDEFISVVSHELRTPITSILGAAGIIRGTQAKSLDEKQKHLIDILYNNSFTLSNLVNDILDVSKLEGGKLNLDIREYDVNEILEEVVKDNATYASQYDVHLKLKRDTPKALIHTDRLRLKQIFNNLVSNAIKHSPEHDSAVIHASISNDNLLVSVQDYGSGIPREFQKRIFNKFEQSQDNNRKVIKGTGLGLYLTKSLVEQFKGEIWYDTEEGLGTTFYVRLPLNLASE